MNLGNAVPSGYVQIVSGTTVAEGQRFERQAQLTTPLRFQLITTEAGPRGWLDAYVDIWVHPGDVEAANEVLRLSRSSS